jgi:hypothetical protein
MVMASRENVLLMSRYRAIRAQSRTDGHSVRANHRLLGNLSMVARFRARTGDVYSRIGLRPTRGGRDFKTEGSVRL